MATESSLLPNRHPVETPEQETLVASVHDPETSELCSTLASETAVNILECMADEPATATDIADRVETSLQNVHYHVENLKEVNLLTIVDTWYSSKGKEMKVYATTHDRVVLTTDAAGSRSVSRPVDDRTPVAVGKEG